MSGITFSGLATGLDTASIISQLVELKRAPVYRLQKDKSGYQNQIKALGTLKTKLLAFQEAALKLDSSNEFSALKATTSDEEFLTVSADSDAAAGNYSIVVKSLAESQKDLSQGYNSLADSIGSGTISFTVDGETTDLTLVGYTSLQSLKDKINNDVEGVSASIVNDGSGTDAYHLVLSSSEAGSAGAYTVDMSGLSGGITPILTNTRPAIDATLMVDGMEVIATSNNPDDLISGLTLDLLQADETKTLNVVVARDTEGMSENMQAFVDSYNDLFGFIEENKKVEGDLRNNPTLRSVASRIQNVFTSPLTGGLGNFTLFSQVGITRGEGLKLDFDSEDFIDALEKDFGSVRDLFIEREGNLGKMYLVDQAVEEMTDSIDGLFKIGTDALNTKIKYADKGIERYERSIEAYRTTQERKFAAMELMVSQLQSQGNYLSSMTYR